MPPTGSRCEQPLTAAEKSVISFDRISFNIALAMSSMVLPINERDAMLWASFSFASLSVFSIIVTFFPSRTYLKYRTLLLLCGKIVVFSPPYVRSPAFIPTRLRDPPSTGVLGPVINMFRVYAGNRSLSMMISSVFYPIPLGWHVIIQCISLQLVSNPGVCSSTLMRAPEVAGMFTNFHTFMNQLAKPIVFLVTKLSGQSTLLPQGDFQRCVIFNTWMNISMGIGMAILTSMPHPIVKADWRRWQAWLKSYAPLPLAYALEFNFQVLWWWLMLCLSWIAALVLVSKKHLPM